MTLVYRTSNKTNKTWVQGSWFETDDNGRKMERTEMLAFYHVGTKHCRSLRGTNSFYDQPIPKKYSQAIELPLMSKYLMDNMLSTEIIY